MKDRDIIITGLQSWEIGIGSNCKNLVLEFSKENRVIYVNPPMDRITKLKKLKESGLNNSLNNSSKIHLEEKNSSLWVLTPQKTIESINKIPSAFLFDKLNKRNNKIFASEIKEAIKIVGFSNYVHFCDSDLHHKKNVYFLGSKPMDQLPAYLKSFDVATNPQLLNEVTIGNYPRKIDEYLASGKPVVATKTLAMELLKIMSI